MRTFKLLIETGYVNCDIESEFEVEDDATDEDIETAARETLWNHISFSFAEVKP